MNREKLEDKIKKRASELACEKIKDCRKKILMALDELVRENLYSSGIRYIPSNSELSRRALNILLSDDFTKGWPKKIWEKCEEEVSQTIMERMSELERMYISKGDNSEEPEKEKNVSTN